MTITIKRNTDMAQQTLERLKELHLPGFVEALIEQDSQPDYKDLSFHERLGFLIDKELMRRENRKLQSRLKSARLKVHASLDQIDYKQGRGLEKRKVLELAQGNWLAAHHNLVISGPTGVGKTFLASALAEHLCRNGHQVLYSKTNDLISTLQSARADGSFKTTYARLLKNHIIVIDEWLREPLSQPQAREILDLIDDRYRTSSAIFVTQLPVKSWHKQILDPTLADAILDRIVHDSIRLELSGESMRKLTSKTSRQS